RIEGVRDHAVRGARADQPGRELVQVGLGDEDRAGRTQAGHDVRVLGGRVGEGRACRRGGPAGRIDVVLGGEGHAVQRQARPVAAMQRDALLELVELSLEPRLVGYGDPGRIAFIQAGQQRAEQLARCAPLSQVGASPLLDGPSARLELTSNRPPYSWHTVLYRTKNSLAIVRAMM